jgi:hypothetical protein
VAEVEDNTFFLVQRLDEIAELWTEHALERPRFRRGDMHFESAGAQ